MATGQTDANGNVSFSSVTSGSHSLTVAKQPYNSYSGTVNVTYDGQRFTVTLTMPTPTTYTITIHVQDEAGAALQSATVDLG